MPCIWQRLNNWSVDWEGAIKWAWKWEGLSSGRRGGVEGHGLVTQVPAKLSINSKSMAVIMQVG